MATPPTLTQAQTDALNTLLNSGLEPPAISAAALAQAIANQRAVSIGKLPGLPSIDQTEIVAFVEWLSDGNGVSDARGEATLASNAVAVNDTTTAIAHVFQLFKNVIWSIYPDIGAAMVAQIQAAQNQTAQSSPSSAPSNSTPPSSSAT